MGRIRGAKSAWGRGKDAAISSLTVPPETDLQPVPPRPHAPRVQAVLPAVGLREGQVREEVRDVVAGKRQVDLGAGLQVPTPRSAGWGGGPHPAPPSRAVLGSRRPIPGNPRPWRRGRSRSLWGLHRPGTAGRCRSRGLCPRSCTPALADRGAGAGGRDAHLAPRRGPSWGPCWQLPLPPGWPPSQQGRLWLGVLPSPSGPLREPVEQSPPGLGQGLHGDVGAPRLHVARAPKPHPPPHLAPGTG